MVSIESILCKGLDEFMQYHNEYHKNIKRVKVAITEFRCYIIATKEAIQRDRDS